MGEIPSDLKEVLVGFRRRLEQSLRVDHLLLFGSRASGSWGKWSDVDLLIVSPSFEGKDLVERSRLVRPFWPHGIPVDILPYTPKEFDVLAKEITLVRTAVAEGVEVS
ncbi:MAG: nucleotidyltransferase domain-containing protein [Euryarchaeota archaeon]|nr:nucleotidyltransferase domain-containing protein [Euryarchaeota archaeon]MDE1882256.1 nucleotidyltransferase domain-containing protein [Euryarchaeota archaeon]MDE2046587.1 nucleotidyltransferase domain-containing protein [Thermoplasmata archaeon]